MSEMEELVRDIFSIGDIKVDLNFDRITYKEAMDNYGSDSPDTRFDMKIKDLSEIFTESKFNVFRNIVNNSGTVGGIKVTGGAEFSRGQIDKLEDIVKTYGAKGLAWFAFNEEEVKSPIAKFLSEDKLTV